MEGGGGGDNSYSVNANELKSAKKKTDEAAGIHSLPIRILIFISILTRPPTTFNRLTT